MITKLKFSFSLISLSQTISLTTKRILFPCHFLQCFYTLSALSRSTSEQTGKITTCSVLVAMKQANTSNSKNTFYTDIAQSCELGKSRSRPFCIDFLILLNNQLKNLRAIQKFIRLCILRLREILRERERSWERERERERDLLQNYLKERKIVWRIPF